MSIVMLFATLYFVPIEEAKGATSSDVFEYDGTNGEAYSTQSYVVIKADIPDKASFFKGKQTIKQVTVQSGAIIGDEAFKGCTNLKTVYLSSSVAVIGKNAFEGTDISSITIPSNVGLIRPDAFYQCKNLKNFYVDYYNPIYTANNGVLMSKDQKKIIAYPYGRTDKTYIIPNEVTTIANSAFHGNQGLTNINIPTKLEKIEARAFMDCSKLVSVTFSANKLDIEEGAFYGTHLTEARIYDTVTYVERGNEDNTILSSFPVNPKFSPNIVIEGNPTAWCQQALLVVTCSNNEKIAVTKVIVADQEYPFEKGADIYITKLINQSGTYSVIALDENDKVVAVKQVVVDKVDSTAPNPVFYRITDDLCTLSSYDSQSGLDAIYYTLNKQNKMAYTGAFRLEQGTNTLTTYAVDKCGNKTVEAQYTITLPYVERSVSFDKQAAQISLGEVFSIVPSYQPTTTENQTLYWTSTNEEVATVSNGVVKGLTEGYTTIRGTLPNGEYAECVVIVKKSQPSLRKTATIYRGKYITLKPTNISNSFYVAYSSDDPSVASVNASGKVTAKSVGEATITTAVFTEYGDYYFNTVVTVKEPYIRLVSYTNRIKKGKSYTFDCDLIGLSGSARWYSSNTKVASVNRTTGRVTARKKGTTYITVKAGIKSRKIKLVVY